MSHVFVLDDIGLSDRWCQEWCIQNANGQWVQGKSWLVSDNRNAATSYRTIWFEDDATALLFKLTWGGK